MEALAYDLVFVRSVLSYELNVHVGGCVFIAFMCQSQALCTVFVHSLINSLIHSPVCCVIA